ncbi:MAG: hypothetical protein VB084_08700 [Syntrophomonadaceae bacterium]|nr:hypothetical protein [Syntrophomonadaceae bacterium]
METTENNETFKVKLKQWAAGILPRTGQIPASLIYMLIFATAAFIGSAAAYYINPTGLLCGVLAVLIYRWK